MTFTDSRGNNVELPEGTPVAWRISAYAIVTDSVGRFLMVQSGNGLWQFPGGGVEQNETIHQAITREVQEETGHTVATESQPFCMNEQQFYHRREEAFYHSLQLFFPARLVLDIPDESLITKEDKDRERSWISLVTLKKQQLHPTIHQLTERYRAIKGLTIQ